MAVDSFLPISTFPAKVVAPKLLEFPAAVTLAEKVPVEADNAAIVVFPKLFELPLAVILPEKPAVVPVKAPPTVNDIPEAVDVAPVSIPPAKVNMVHQ